MRIGMVGSLIGWGCLIVAVFWMLADKKYSIGNKAIGLPLLALAILQNMQGVELAARLMPVLMFAVYLVATRVGRAAFLPVGLVSTIGGIVLILENIIVGHRTGGFYSIGNYNIAIGAIILGAVLWQSRWQWLVMLLAVAAVAASGAEEGLVALSCLALAMILRADFSHARQAIASAIVLGLAIAIMLQWHPIVASRIEAATEGNYTQALDMRIDAYKFAVQDITWLGHGYDPNGATGASIHSVPLMALQQTGIVGMCLWLWTMGYGVLKTRMKYAFVAMLGLSLFDNYLWTQIMPYTWAVAGVASVEEGSDFILRRNNANSQQQP